MTASATEPTQLLELDDDEQAAPVDGVGQQPPDGREHEAAGPIWAKQTMLTNSGEWVRS